MEVMLVIFVKSRKDGKVPIRKTVTRGGKTFTQTFWMSPAEVTRTSSPSEDKVSNRINASKKKAPVRSSVQRKKVPTIVSSIDRFLAKNKVPNASGFRDVILRDAKNESDIKENMSWIHHLIGGRTLKTASEIIKVTDDVNMEELVRLSSHVYSNLLTFDGRGYRVGARDYIKWLKENDLSMLFDPDSLSTPPEDEFMDDSIDGFELVYSAVKKDMDPDSVLDDRMGALDEERKVYHEVFDSYKDLSLDERERLLSVSPISRYRPLKGGINQSFRVITGEPPKGAAVWKPGTGEETSRRSVPKGTFYKREVLAYKLARAIGSDLIPPTVGTEIEGVPGSMQEFQYECRTADTIVGFRREKLSENVRFEASVLDFLLGNTDRHDGNFLINQRTGKLVLIDHGLCFPEYFSEFRVSSLYEDGWIPDDLMDRLMDVDWELFLEKMRTAGLSEDSIGGFNDRLVYVTKRGHLPSMDALSRMMEEDRISRMMEEDRV